MDKVNNIDQRELKEEKINYPLAFTYISKDPAWVRRFLVGMGLLTVLGFISECLRNLWFIPLILSILPVSFIAVIFIEGYIVRTIRWVASGEKRSLPKWEDTHGLVNTGLKYLGIRFLYGLPLMILSSLIALLIRSLVPQISMEKIMGVIFWIGGQIILSFIEIAVDIRFASTDSIRRCFDLDELILFLKNNLKDYLVIYSVGIVYLFLWAIFLPNSFLMAIRLSSPNTAVESFFRIVINGFSFYPMMVLAHLKGQLFEKNVTKGLLEAYSEQKKKKSVEDSESYLCPDCEAVVYSEDMFCPQCGKRVRWDKLDDKEKIKRRGQRMYECNVCGRDVLAKDKYCRHCSEKFE